MWSGNFNSIVDLEKYIETEYTDDGVCHDSKFETDFKME
ncbi:immunity 22 family protein [Clostridium saccharoperbutylacetonicum]